MKFRKHLFDFNKNTFSPVEIDVVGGKIQSISLLEKSDDVFGYILPGLIDSHIHIESSMLVPSRFSEFALKHGVVSVVADPHEISNVLGVDGFSFMLEDSKMTPLKIHFAVPSCVPATSFETSGAVFSPQVVDDLLSYPKVVALGEMMNFPGVIHNDKDVIKMIESAVNKNKVVDGHAPSLSGDDLLKYISAGISTDHEASTYDEAVEKIKNGMIIQIREGSAAKNFEDLWTLIDEFPGKVMLCTDDSHPDDLEFKYIDSLIRRGLKKGLKFKNLYKAAFFTPIIHYGLTDIGQLKIGDNADFILVDDIDDFVVKQTFIDGELVYDQGNVLFDAKRRQVLNNFNVQRLCIEDLKINSNINAKNVNIIKAFDGMLYTDFIKQKVYNNSFEIDINNDFLKIVVLNRYEKNKKPTVAFINGFGFKSGAIASSIAHDSHNIIAIGASNDDIVAAINKLIELQGGIVVVKNKEIDFLQLEIAGLMTYQNPKIVSKKYNDLNTQAISLGSELKAPFMTMSFMALLVIPRLKISDKGLFDFGKFNYVKLFDD